MPSSYRKKVKIVCTLGPATQESAMVRALIEEGMDIARMNFSHGDHAFHLKTLTTVREASRVTQRPVALLQDLQGPKLRAGKLPGGGLDLKVGDTLLLYPEGSIPTTSTHGKILVPISAEIALSISKDMEKGARILFDDGKLATRAIEVAPPEIVVEVEVGGRLTNHKGMNLPGTPLTMSCLTEKDLKDLKFGLDHGVDAIALSFVRSPRDLEDLKARILKVSNECPMLIPKIEREEALEVMDEIIELSDGLLIARGDMAVELGAERVPAIQKQLIRSCNQVGLPVITATQMLESMINSPTPTRAEASDVANAVFDGTDAVMLSGETASGEYPRETVRVMSRIILEAERSIDINSKHAPTRPIPGSIVDAIELSASEMARQVGAIAIACLTHSGMAARTLSKFRPETPIIAILDNERMLRRLSFVWGVNGVMIPEIVATDDLFGMVEKVLLTHGWAQATDLVVVTAGVPTLRRGTTNMVKVHRVGAPSSR